MFLPSRDLSVPGRESRGSGPVRPRTAVSKTASGGSNPPYRAMFNKDKATLSIRSIKSSSMEIVELNISGPSHTVLAAFTSILSGATTVTVDCPGPTEAPEELPDPPESPVRLIDPYQP